MILRAGTPQTLLVIAPHPDDETIGAFGLMLRSRRRGVHVRVMVVTDGAASHAGSPTWSGRRLSRERQRETRRAVRSVGVHATHVEFLGLPDGKLSSVTDRVRRAICSAIRRVRTPALVVGPAGSDDHPDHRIVAAAIRSARTAGVRTIAYPVWPAGRALPRARSLWLTAQERLAKRHTIRRYRTQIGRITDDPAGFAMTRSQIAAFSRPVETFVEDRA